MTLAKTLLAGLMLAPAMAYSSVTLNVPIDVQLLTVNEKDVGFSNFGFDHKDSITLEDGINQVVFRISKVVSDGGNKGTKYTSVPLVATFESSDETLFIHVPKITSLSQGSGYNDKPTFSIRNEDGEISSLKKGKVNAGLKFYADIVAEVERFNKTDEPASLKHFKQATKAQTTQGSNISSIDMEVFKAQFKQFSKEEKQAFLSWAVSNIN